MKKIIIITFALILTLMVVGANEGINMPRGNNKQNILAAREISRINGIGKFSVLSHGDTVMVGVDTLDGAEREAVKSGIAEQIRRFFPEFKKCLLGTDSLWADAVVELALYIDGGMSTDVVEKRFRYLAEEGAKSQDLTN